MSLGSSCATHPWEMPAALPPQQHALCCYCLPSRTPQESCSSQAASACSSLHPSLAIRKPFQEGARKLSSCEAEQGMQAASVMPGAAAQSLIYHPPARRACPASLPQQGTSTTPSPDGVNEGWPLPTASQSLGKEHTAYLKANRSLGTHPELSFLWKLTSSLVTGLVIY